MQRLDTIKLNSFIEYKNELLELIRVDFLDEIADVFNHQTKKYKTIGLFEYVIPVDVKIQKISTGDTFPVCKCDTEENLFQNVADYLTRITPILLAAVKTLERLGYIYRGGESWKPPAKKRNDIND